MNSHETLTDHHAPTLEAIRSSRPSHDLAAAASQLREHPTFRARGHNAATLVKHADQRIVLMVIGAGARIHEHKAVGAASIHVLSGRVRMQLSEESIELGAGCLLALEGGVPHDVEGLEDASLLITLSWSPAQPPHAG